MQSAKPDNNRKEAVFIRVREGELKYNIFKNSKTYCEKIKPISSQHSLKTIMVAILINSTKWSSSIH